MIHIVRGCGGQEFVVKVNDVSTHVSIQDDKTEFISFAHNMPTDETFVGKSGVESKKILPAGMGEAIETVFHDYWVDNDSTFIEIETAPIYLRFNPKNFKPFYKFSAMTKLVSSTPVDLVFTTLKVPKGYRLTNRFMKYLTIAASKWDEEQELVDIIFSYPLMFKDKMRFHLCFTNEDTGSYLLYRFLYEHGQLAYYSNEYTTESLPTNPHYCATITTDAIKSDKVFDLPSAKPRIISNLVATDSYDYKTLKNRLFDELHGSKKFTKIILLNAPASKRYYDTYVATSYVHTVTVAVNIPSSEMTDDVRHKYTKLYTDFGDVNYLCNDNKIVY